MERLTAHGFAAILVLVLPACLVLIAQTAVLCWGFSHLDRHRIRRTLPEATALAVALCITLLLGGGWKLELMGLPPTDWLLYERVFAGTAAVGAGLFSMRWTPRRGGLLTAAGVFSLPLFDIFLPVCALLVLLLLAGRVLLLIRHIRAWSAREVTVASIREGLDLLPDGLLFARADHTAVLVNITMLRFMERTLGRQYRSADVFWQELMAFDDPATADKIVHENAVLLRFAAGDAWLVQRVRLTEGLDGWQLTASCVTEADAVSRELEAKNAALSATVSAQKELLATLEKTERHRTLQDITSRVHDVLGQRISMLQQLLASPAPKDALDTIIRIDSLLEEVPLMQEEHPATLLADMTDTYTRLGVRLVQTGELPRSLRRARAFAAIIREGLSNAVCHGRANEIRITLTEHRLCIRDNGIGCTTLRPGGGLAGMIRRVNELGGHLRITTSPHFELDAQIGEDRR